MDIDWFGQSCFRIREANVTAVADPYDKSIGYTLPRLRADILTVSHDAPGHSAVGAVKGEPKVLTDNHTPLVTEREWEAATKGEQRRYLKG